MITTKEIIESCIEVRGRKFIDYFNKWVCFEEGRVEREQLKGIEAKQQEYYIKGAKSILGMFQEENYLN